MNIPIGIKRKNMSKLKNLTNPIVVLSFLGILLGIGLIYKARNQSYEDGEAAQALGFVGEASEDVRLKRMGNMHWYVAEVAQKLYQGDLIFSGEKARTVLKLKDHGELTLGPYSMVIIQPGFIQVESGEVELKADQPTTIKTFGEEIKVSTNTSTTIIDRPKLKKITLSKKDEQKPINIRAQEVLKTVIEKEAVAEVAKKKEIAELEVLGLTPVWEPEKQKMVLSINSPEEFDRCEVIVRNEAFEKAFPGTRSVELTDLPAGKYQVTAHGYFKDQLVSKSVTKDLEVVIPIQIQKLEKPTLENSNIELSL